MSTPANTSPGWRDISCSACGCIAREFPPTGEVHCATCEERAALARLAALATNESPKPLRREMPPPAPFPVDEMPGVLRDAVQAIHDRTQAPPSVCAQSALGASSLAAQVHYDLLLPHGSRRPSSLFLVSVAESGERKTTADEIAQVPIKDREQRLALEYAEDRHTAEIAQAAWETQRKNDLRKAKTLRTRREALEALGPEPPMPPPPFLSAPDPTIEGLHKLYEAGVSSLGLFATEGAQFLGGHGMNSDNRLKTAAALSALWEGEVVRRVRSGDGASRLPGRRLSAHLQVQPGVALNLFADQRLIDQGLVSRVLPQAPSSTAGRRLWREAPDGTTKRLDAYNARLAELLKRPRRMAAEPGALDPIPIALNPEAKRLWIAFADDVERDLAPNCALASVRGFGSKLPEHAVRLAVVMAAVAKPDFSELTGEDLARGIALAKHYASEALRLHDARLMDPDLELAARTLDWLNSTHRPQFSLVDVYQYGPGPVRDAKTARRIVGVLDNHGYLLRLPSGTEIDGTRRDECWELRQC